MAPRDRPIAGASAIARRRGPERADHAAARASEGRDAKIVAVAAAVVLRPDGSVLLAQRPAGKVYAGYWEFPGGKIEPGETPRAALDRELAEELGLEVRAATPWIVRDFTYAHARVRLHFFRVTEFGGTPSPFDGQAFAWQSPQAPSVAPMLPANDFVLRALALPPVCGITMAADLGAREFLARARVALGRGLRLVQLREKEWPIDKQRRLGESLLALAHAAGARVVLNGEVTNALAWGFDGVHWTSARLAAAVARPRGLLCSASCHTREDVAKAGELGLDFVVLGPIRPTPSHPFAVPLGFDGFAAAAADACIPVYALGGLTGGDLDAAIARGAHGVALRRAAWE